MSNAEGNRDFWRVIFAWFLPPLAVFLQVGLTLPFWINVVLLFLGGLPAVLHALWVIANVQESGRGNPEGTRTFFSLLLCGLLPPLGVFLKQGLSGGFVLNVLLTLFFWVPGIIHAVWVITHDN